MAGSRRMNPSMILRARFFYNFLNEAAPCKAVIEIGEDDHVDDGVDECVQTERAAAFERLAPFENGVDRGTHQREYKQCDGVTACALFEILNEVRREAAGEIIEK